MNKLIFIHGFNYDPRTFGPNHPEHHLYARWRQMLQRGWGTVGFTWFSNPGLWNAWRHGYLGRYKYTWVLAEQASDRLASLIAASQDKVDIVCHSLGSRVTMLALQRISNVSRVLILNGAEYSTTGEAVARACPEVKFYNVVVPADDVLGTVARFAPGHDWKFLGSHGLVSAPSNWQDLRLDDEGSLAQGRAKELGLPIPAGDNPHQVGDHWYSYENEDNWPVYRAIFSGEWDVGAT